jgi:signal transduction histidine kinase
VWPSRDGKQFAFVHDAIREALHASMAEETRLRLHRVAGRMLEDEDPTAMVEIAFHFDAGGEHERALPYALEAAEQARSRRALATAARQYEIARRGMTSASVTTRASVLVGLGEVLLLLGRYEEAQRTLESALSLATASEPRAHIENLLADIDLNRGDARGAAERIASALRRLGYRVPRRLAWFALAGLWQLIVQAAHTLLPSLFVGRGRPPTRSEATVLQLHSRLAYALYYTGTIPSVWAQLRELNLAERRGPGPELAQAWSNHAILAAALPLFSRALRYAERALALRRQLGDVWGEGQALHFKARVEYGASRFTPAIESARHAMRLLESAGDRWEYDDAAAVDALSHFALGDLTIAVALARKLYRAADEIGDAHPRALALQLWANATGGDIPAELVSDALAVPSSHVLASSAVLAADGVRRLAVGETDAATEALDRAFTQVRKAKIRISHVVQIPLLLSGALRARAAKLPPWLPRERARLLARARHVTRIGLRAARSFQNYLPFALREAGVLAALRGSRRRAIRLLEDSERVARSQGARYELARTSLFLRQLTEGSTEQAKRRLIELGAGFELAPSEKPIVLSLADRFTRLLEGGRGIVRSLKRDDIFAALVSAALQTLRAEACEVRDASSISRSASAEWTRLLAKAARDGHAVVIPGPLLNQLDTGYASAGSRSAVWAPVFAHGKLAGALFASHSRIRGLFAQDELAIVNFLTTLAGAALENAEGFARAEEAIRARDEFLQIASHEIRTPLTPFKLNLQLVEKLLEREPNVDAAVQERIAGLMRATDRQVVRLTVLLDQLLEASVVGTDVRLVLDQVDLGTLVSSVVKQLQPQIRAAGIEVLIEPHGEIVGTWDRHRLRSVVVNLLGNALKFGARRNVIVTLTRHESTAVMRVRDFGIGIAAADKERLFERLERAVSARHFGGLGLGLYIARRLVEAHGGTIHVESGGLGEGSTFIVELPLATPDSRSEQA